MSYFCGKYPIIEKKTLGAGVYSVTVNAPECASAAVPGQFANIAAPGFTLRRPISVCGIDKERGTLRFVFEVRGKGTKAISDIREGECLDILAPLGNGFKIPEGRVIVVGGGIGVPPLLGVSAVKGSECTAILGFRDYSKIILDNEFRANGSEAVICTDDGSVGVHGLVTVPLADRLSEYSKDATVLACGPEPMLKAVVSLCKEDKVPCQISLEQRMGCGVGACVVCSCMTVRNGEEYYARVCKDGPVFNAEEVKFDA